MILSAQSILTRCFHHQLITPFEERTRHGGVTFGLSSAGYDVRVEFDEDGLQYERVLEPGQFMLASTIEKFQMPDDLVGIVHDKSSWARRGLAVQNTVIEPGWSGWLTLELTNHGPEPLIINRGVGIAQVLFHQLDVSTDQPYEGKYQAQRRGPVEAVSESSPLSSDPGAGRVNPS